MGTIVLGKMLLALNADPTLRVGTAKDADGSPLPSEGATEPIEARAETRLEA